MGLARSVGCAAALAIGLVVLGPAGSTGCSGGGAAMFQPCGSGGSLDCANGLSCVAQPSWGNLKAGPTGAFCTEETMFCSLPCNVDSDCAPMGTAYKCVPGCNAGPSACDIASHKPSWLD